MRLKLYQVDAFTKELFKGNPAAVCPLDEWLSADLMQKIAAENNLSETAFFVENNGGYEIRWFTPQSEIDLCGHATLASAFVIFEVLKASNGNTLLFKSHISGDLHVAKDDTLIVLDFPSRKPEACSPPQELITAIGRQPIESLKSRDYVFVYESERDIDEIKPDFNLMAAASDQSVIITAKGDSADFVSRFFAPGISINEDPVTGSAHCSLIPFWAERLGKNKLFARQKSERGGELFCELAGSRVKIGGNAVLYMEGEINVGAEKSKITIA